MSCRAGSRRSWWRSCTRQVAAITETGVARPYLLLGPATYVSHEGDRPIAITWHLRDPVPDYLASATVAAL